MKTKISYRKNSNVKFKLRKIIVILAIFTIVSGLKFVKQDTVNAYSNGNRQVIEVYTVKQGDSIWTIAGAYSHKNIDRRHMVDKIKAYNNLAETDIYPNDKLYIPVNTK